MSNFLEGSGDLSLDVPPSAGEDADLVPRRREVFGQVGEVLPRRGDVGPVVLIDEEEGRLAPLLFPRCVRISRGLRADDHGHAFAPR